MKNNKKVEKKVLTEEEEYLVNELADIFVESIMFEVEVERQSHNVSYPFSEPPQGKEEE